MLDDSGTPTPVDAGLRCEIASLLPDMRAFARFLARDAAAADDLVQDTVVRALAALDQFTPGTNLRAWLFRIERNAFYEGLRRRRRENAVLHDGAVDEAPRIPEQLARSEVLDLQQLIWTLSPLLREALILIAVQELTYEEAATICGVPVGTMKARLSRARSALARNTHEASERKIDRIPR